MLRRKAAVALCLAFVMCFLGCSSGGGGDHPEAASVTGTVTYKGAPVEGAVVSFAPKDEGGSGAIGTTDSKGKFTLQTQWGAAGAVPGNYAVTISKTETEGTSDADLEVAQIGDSEEAPAAKVTEALPVKYKSASTSELSAEVKAGEENDFPFDLTD